MEIIKRIALRDLEPSPDWRFSVKKGAFELKDVFERPPSGNGQYLDDRPFAHHMLDSYRPCVRADDFFISIGFRRFFGHLVLTILLELAKGKKI